MAFVRTGRHVRPVPAAALSIEALRLAGVSRCLVVVADWKLELVRVLGDGSDLGLAIAYLHRGVPRGLADAVAQAKAAASSAIVELSKLKRDMAGQLEAAPEPSSSDA